MIPPKIFAAIPFPLLARRSQLPSVVLALALQAALFLGSAQAGDTASLRPGGRAPNPATPVAQNSSGTPLSIELLAPELDMGGELTLLPNSAPVQLEARLDRQAIDANGLRILKYRYDWSADHGEIGASSQSPFQAWLPPNDSLPCTVKVTYRAELQPLNDRTRTFAVSCSATKSFLSITRPEQFKDGRIDGGFKIGFYPDPWNSDKVYEQAGVPRSKWSNWPRNQYLRYLPPAGFYKVEQEDADRRISPNFTLRFFIMDYPWLPGGFPQYVAIDMRLLRKLEDLLALMRDSGFHITTFVPIYGFRSPAYNMESIVKEGSENLKAPFSMHQYGRAADMIVDEDGDLSMDDLNRDGRVDVYDAAEVMKYVNVLDAHYRDQKSDLVGGAGIYDHHDFFKRPVQSPYVHVDVRGFVGEENRLIRWPWADEAKWPDGTPIVGLEKLRP